MGRRTSSIEPAWFERLYTGDPDPWRFASSDYEREKYAATLGALPARRYDDALEVGCSIGVFTSALAPLCTRLLAIDVADAALVRARARCPGVTFEKRAVPHGFPAGSFDLILFSEVLYYLDAGDRAATARRAAAALRPNGTILLVHYLGLTDYPATGDEAADEFIAASALTPSLQVREARYRLDRLDRAAAPE